MAAGKDYQFAGARVYYVDPTDYATNLGDLDAYDGTTMDERITSFNAAFTSVYFGRVGSCSLTHGVDNEQKIYSLEDLFINTSDKKTRIAGELLENTKIDTLATLITADRQTETDGEYMGYETKNAVGNVTAYKIISLPYKVDDAVKPWRRQYIYMTSASLKGDLVTQFYRQGDTFKGIDFEVESDGGVFISFTKEGATQGSV